MNTIEQRVNIPNKGKKIASQLVLIVRTAREHNFSYATFQSLLVLYRQSVVYTTLLDYAPSPVMTNVE